MTPQIRLHWHYAEAFAIIGAGCKNLTGGKTMAESRKSEPVCPFHRAEIVVDELSAQWRTKAAKLTPQAADALAQSLRSLRNILDRRIHDIEAKDRAEGEAIHVRVKPEAGE